MVSFDHKNIIRSVSSHNFPPSDVEEYSSWLTGDHQIAFLRENARQDELVMYAGADHFYLETAKIPLSALEDVNIEELLHWNGRVFDSCASYVTGGGRKDAWIERDAGLSGSAALSLARPLLFGRQFEGLDGPDALYFEVLQEYAHLNGIHWRPEHKAYCRFDENGDFLPVVSVTTRKSSDNDISLVTFRRGPLDEYLAADRSALIRMFDFTCLRLGDFDRWPDGPDEIVRPSESFAFCRKVDKGKASYIRGVQIIKGADLGLG